VQNSGSMREILGEEAWRKFCQAMSDRSKRGIRARALEYKWPNASPPLGYDKTTDMTIKVNADEAKLVQRIFEMYLREKSLPQVAFNLNLEKVPKNTGGKWSTTTLREILGNEIYIGVYRYAGVQKYIPRLRIVSDEIFERVSETLRRYETLGAERPPMPDERRHAVIEKMFGRYQDFLKELEKKNLIGQRQHWLEIWREFGRASSQSEKNIVFALSEITRVVIDLAFPPAVLEGASSWYRIALEGKFLQGRSIRAFCAAAIYATCRDRDIAISLNEVADASVASKKMTWHCYRILKGV